MRCEERQRCLINSFKTDTSKPDEDGGIWNMETNHEWMNELNGDGDMEVRKKKGVVGQTRLESEESGTAGPKSRLGGVAKDAAPEKTAKAKRKMHLFGGASPIKAR